MWQAARDIAKIGKAAVPDDPVVENHHGRGDRRAADAAARDQEACALAAFPVLPGPAPFPDNDSALDPRPDKTGSGKQSIQGCLHRERALQGWAIHPLDNVRIDKDCLPGAQGQFTNRRTKRLSGQRHCDAGRMLGKRRRGADR
ncbi:hypothetical protein Sj15T_22530 [Sphingobium sp. TA15]|nr:hypothetical protein Sj15T_22530 [Sphingobium sp. TA15]